MRRCDTIRRRAPVCRRAFTLVELLVVIAIIGLMVAMVIPAVQASREAARRAQCTQNMLTNILALRAYEDAHEHLPAGVINPTGPIRNEAVGMHHGWLEQLLPYLGEANLYRQIDFDVSVYDPKNEALARFRPSSYICPSSYEAENTASSYAGCHHDVEAPIAADNLGVLYLNSQLREDEIADGAAYTIFIGEKRIESDDLSWMSGTRATLRNTGLQPVCGPIPAAHARNRIPKDPAAALLYVGPFGSDHPGGAVFAFGDGSARLINEDIDLRLFQQLGNRADGQLVEASRLNP